MLAMFNEHKVKLELAKQREKENVRPERKPSPDHLSFVGHWWDIELILSMVGGSLESSEQESGMIRLQFFENHPGPLA